VWTEMHQLLLDVTSCRGGQTLKMCLHSFVLWHYLS
jgi:hypothetical protein